MSSTTTIGKVEFERFIQSSFRIAGAGITVYVDPHRMSDMPAKADIVLITHEHFDHMDPDAINAVAKEDTVIVANAPCARQLQGKVEGRLLPIEEGGSLTEKGVSIKAVAGYNSYHPRGFNVGFLFKVDDLTIYHGGDTNRVPEMITWGAIDVALIPIGGTYTMDEEEGAQAVRDMKPIVAIPMHYGYATGGDPQKFASLVGEAAQVVIL